VPCLLGIEPLLLPGLQVRQARHRQHNKLQPSQSRVTCCANQRFASLANPWNHARDYASGLASGLANKLISTTGKRLQRGQPAGTEPDFDKQAHDSSWVTETWGHDATAAQVWHCQFHGSWGSRWQHQQYPTRERSPTSQLHASHQEPAIAWHAGQPSKCKPLPELLACTLHADTNVTQSSGPSSPCGDGSKRLHTANKQPEIDLQLATSLTTGGTEINASQLSVQQASVP